MKTITPKTPQGKGGDDTPTTSKRVHDSRLCTCSACLLRELRIEAVRLRDAIDEAQKTDGFPVLVAEISLSIGGYGRIFKTDAEYQNVVLNPEATAAVALLDDEPDGGAA